MQETHHDWAERSEGLIRQSTGISYLARSLPWPGTVNNAGDTVNKVDILGRGQRRRCQPEGDPLLCSPRCTARTYLEPGEPVAWQVRRWYMRVGRVTEAHARTMTQSIRY
jgi:hypothetical protein